MTAGSWPSPRGGASHGATQGFRRYYQPIREHWLLVVVCVVVAVGGAAVYAKATTKRYSAQAELLVSAAPQSDATLVGLPVIHASGDPTQDVLTGASLVTTNEVANAVIAALHLHTSAGNVLSQVQANPVGQSNLIAVQANATSATAAQQLANAFAAQAIAVRTAAVHAAIANILPGLQAQAAAEPAAVRDQPGGLGDTLTQLEQLQHTNDPTLALVSRAQLPSGPYTPRTKLALLAGLLGGLILGIGAALAWSALDPRLQREEQVRELLEVPILARIPRVRTRRTAQPLTPEELPMPAMEGYRTLRTILAVRAEGTSRAYLVTGTAPSEGKTTTAMGLAVALAQGGARVILIEADLRRPTFASSLGLNPVHGTEEVLIGKASLDQALIPVRIDGTPLRVLASREAGVDLADRLSFAVARRLIDDARSRADFVVIDSPPMAAVIDALPLAQFADELLVVARVGLSSLKRLVDLDELFYAHGTYATGLVLVGGEIPRDGYGYYTDPDAQSSGRHSSLNGESARPRRLPRPARQPGG